MKGVLTRHPSPNGPSVCSRRNRCRERHVPHDGYEARASAAASQIQVQGGRYNEAGERMTNL